MSVKQIKYKINNGKELVFDEEKYKAQVKKDWAKDSPFRKLMETLAKE